MTARPEALYATSLWAQRAEADLLAAEHILTLRASCGFRVVSFHAQQRAEKCMKALWLLHSIRFPQTHGLTKITLVLNDRADRSVSLSGLAALGADAVEARYPGDCDPIERPVSEEALATPRKVSDAIRDHLPVEALSGGSGGA